MNGAGMTIEAKTMKLWRSLLWLAAMAMSLAAPAAETVVYYHNDIAGSPVVATDASGTVLWRESYRPYGERLTNAPASVDNKVWFTSRRQDVETGLVYMGARYYDPVIGRFISMDPVGFDEANIHSHNRYAYANNNPYRYKDPDGRVAETIWDLASFTLSVAMFKQDPSLGNFLGAAVDGVALAIPFVPGGVGAIRAIGNSAEAATRLGDKALVCRGGSCTAERFSQGSKVSVDAEGKLSGVSVNAGTGKSIEELTVGIPNKQVGVTTVGDIRRAGGDVVPSPSSSNPNHCTLCGVTAKDAERLFTPTVRNPNVP